MKRIALLLSIATFGCQEKKDEPQKPAVFLKWTAKDGTVHFTDDRTTIPKGAKIEETAGGNVQVVAAPKKVEQSPAQVGTKDSWQARYREQRGKIKELEAALAKDLPHIGDAETNWVLEEANAGDTTFENALFRVKQNRKELARQEQAYRELEKSADAVGVPKDWRE